MSGLPSTLLEWKDCSDAVPYWEALRPFFAEQGYDLFLAPGGFARPREPNTIRTADPYHHWIPYMGPAKSELPLERRIHYPARYKDGTDVLIRLVAKGGFGTSHVKILQKLAELDPYHEVAVPLLKLLEKDDMTFAIFPLLEANDLLIWSYDVEDVLEYLQQIFESFAFLHSHRIDFGNGEILINFGRGQTQLALRHNWTSEDGYVPTKWRTLFPIRYWLNDFELAVQFADDSEPRACLVQGIPTASWGMQPQEYLKELAPEALDGEPYCPFKAEVYVVAFNSAEVFLNIPVESVIQLFSEMLFLDPEKRPTFAEAAARIIAIRKSLTPDVLATKVEERYASPWATHILPENRVDPHPHWSTVDGKQPETYIAHLAAMKE